MCVLQCCCVNQDYLLLTSLQNIAALPTPTMSEPMSSMGPTGMEALGGLRRRARDHRRRPGASIDSSVGVREPARPRPQTYRKRRPSMSWLRSRKRPGSNTSLHTQKLTLRRSLAHRAIALALRAAENEDPMREGTDAGRTPPRPLELHYHSEHHIHHRPHTQAQPYASPLLPRARAPHHPGPRQQPPHRTSDIITEPHSPHGHHVFSRALNSRGPASEIDITDS